MWKREEQLPVSVFTNVDHTGVIPELNPGLLYEQPAVSFLNKSANFVRLSEFIINVITYG